MTPDFLSYAFNDSVDSTIEEIIIRIPARWGRMPPLSRAVVVEAGKLLQKEKLLRQDPDLAKSGKTVGLIGGSRFGSYTTDQSFAETMAIDTNLSSPAIFGYTLANIPLAEAANQYGLIGPVYALIDNKNPFEKACKEGNRLLHSQSNIDFMLACEFDDHYDSDNNRQLCVTFTLLKRHD